MFLTKIMCGAGGRSTVGCDYELQVPVAFVFIDVGIVHGGYGLVAVYIFCEFLGFSEIYGVYKVSVIV